MAWEDVEVAFDGILKTDMIVNLRHLDIRDFLDNAKTQFLEEMQKVIR